MVDFQCSYHGIDLCLNQNATCKIWNWIEINNGTAVNRTFDEFGCVCPPGVGADNFFFHFENCSLPDRLYLIVLVYFSAIAFVITSLLVREFWNISHNKTRIIAISNATALVFTWCMTMALYFQNGLYEAGALFATLGSFTTLYMAGKLSTAFMETHYAVRRIPPNKLRSVFRILTIISCVMSLVLGIPLIAISRGPNSKFNLVAWFFEINLMVWSALFCIIISYHTSILLVHIRNASTLKGMGNDSRKAIFELITKVTSIRNTTMLNTIITFLIIPKTCIFFIFGSVPYQWVWGVVVNLHGLILSAIVILAFVKPTKKQGKEKEEIENHSSAPETSQQKGEEDDLNPILKSSKRKMREMHTTKNGQRNFLFRGSSLMTKQFNNADFTKMTYDRKGLTADQGVRDNSGGVVKSPVILHRKPDLVVSPLETL